MDNKLQAGEIWAAEETESLKIFLTTWYDIQSDM